jgi:thiol-disulfide isomerase/thioredoxin
MRSFIKNAVVFVLFVFAISDITSCNRTTPSTATNETTAEQSPIYTNSNETKASMYPPLNAALADAQFELVDGTKSKISDHKGKVVLVNLWGIWCPPCVAEMPALSQMQQTYGEKGFEVLGLNIGADDAGTLENLDAIKTFAAKKQISYALARVDHSLAAEFYKISKADVVPQSFLINREGQLRGVFVGGGQSIINSINNNVQRALAE